MLFSCEKRGLLQNPRGSILILFLLSVNGDEVNRAEDLKKLNFHVTFKFPFVLFLPRMKKIN